MKFRMPLSSFAAAISSVSLASVLSVACAQEPDQAGAGVVDFSGAPVAAALSTLPDLNATISGPASVAASTTATYQVTTTNLGGSKAYSPRINITLPAGYSVSSGTGGCIWYSTTRTVTCSFTNMNPAAVRAGTYTVVFPAAGGTLMQQAIASLNGTDANTANNQATLATAVIGADLAVTLAGATALPGGSSSPYTLSVKNNGTISATSVWATVSVPTGAYPTSYPGCVLAAFPTRIRCNLGTITPGATLTRTLTYGFPYAAGAYALNAFAVGAVAEPALTNGNNSASVAVATSALTPVPVTLSVPVPQMMELTNCFGDPGNFGSMAACPAAWIQSGVITFLDGGLIDTGDVDVTGTWTQPNGPESLEFEFHDAGTGALIMWMDGFGTSATCYEGLNWWPTETQNRGAFRICAI